MLTKYVFTLSFLHLDRNWKAAQPVHQLRFIRNADKLARLGRHNLLARQRRARRNRVALAINLVGPVNVDRQLAHIVGIKHLNAQCLQA